MKFENPVLLPFVLHIQEHNDTANSGKRPRNMLLQSAKQRKKKDRAGTETIVCGQEICLALESLIAPVHV